MAMFNNNTVPVSFENDTKTPLVVDFLRDQESQRIFIIRRNSKVNCICKQSYTLKLRWTDYPKLTKIDKYCLTMLIFVWLIGYIIFFQTMLDEKISLKVYFCIVMILSISFLAAVSFWYYQTYAIKLQVKNISLDNAEYRLTLCRRRTFIDAMCKMTCQHDLLIEKRLQTPLRVIW